MAAKYGKLTNILTPLEGNIRSCHFHLFFRLRY